MNHKCALQRKSDARWDYTINGHPTGYCCAYEPLKECTYFSKEVVEAENAKMEPFIGNFHTDGHSTKEEACECYKRYMLDTQLRLPAKEPEKASQAQKCQVCQTWTACIAMVGSYSMFFLCPEHCTRENVEKLYRVGESWES